LCLLTVFFVFICLLGCSSGGGASGSPASSSSTHTNTNTNTKAIFIADADTDGVDELYITEFGNPGVATKLNAPLVAGGLVTDFQISPLGDCVLYRADQEIDDVFELYLVSLENPGATVKVNGLLVGGGDVTSSFLFSPDGTQVAYLADEDTNEEYELFLVNLSIPGFSANLSGPLVSRGDVYSGFTFIPDGSAVVYLADEESDGVNELFIVETGVPGYSTKLNEMLVGGGDVLSGFVVTPAGSEVVYQADQRADNVFELYLVDLTIPGISTTLSSPMPAGRDVLGEFVISPAGDKVAYLADQDIDNVFELYVVELNTPGVSYKINRNPTTNGDVVASGFRFSPDGGALAYVADEDYNDLIEFYLVELAFPAISTKLNSPLVPGGDLTTVFRFTPEDSQLIYLADQDEDEVFEIYRVDITDPGYSVKMNSPLIAGGSVQVATLIMSGGGNELVYLADQDADDVVELYVVEMTLPGVSQKLNPTLPAGGDVVMVDVFPRS
jgi:Tol biopolymer transport system component